MNNIGNVHSRKGDYQKALEHYNKCLEINTKINRADSIDGAHTLYNIGNVHSRKGEYEKALEQFTKSLDIFIKVNGGTCENSALISNHIKLLKEFINDS